MDASIASFATDELRMLNRLKNGPEIQHSQPNSGSAPVHFEGVDIEKLQKKRETSTDHPPEWKLSRNSNFHN